MMIFLSLLVAQFSQASGVISLRADNWCPYNCDPKSDKPGYMIEIAKEIFEPAGFKVDYQTLNWARAIEDSRKGKFTGIVGAGESDAPDFIFPENKTGSNKNCFFAKDASWKFSDEKSLENATIGVIRDYTYGDPIDSYVKKNEKNKKLVDVVSGDNPLELNVKKLDAKRLTAFLENTNVMAWYEKSNNSKSKLVQVGCLRGDDVSIAFSPKDPKAKEYASMMSKGTEELRKNGKLKKILDKYGVLDWK